VCGNDDSPIASTPFTLSAGASYADVDLVVLTQHIEGFVSDPTERPIPGLRVVLTPYDVTREGVGSGSQHTAFTNREGRYRFPHMVVGDYYLRFHTSEETRSGNSHPPFTLVAAKPHVNNPVYPAVAERSTK